MPIQINFEKWNRQRDRRGINEKKMKGIKGNRWYGIKCYLVVISTLDFLSKFCQAYCTQHTVRKQLILKFDLKSKGFKKALVESCQDPVV